MQSGVEKHAVARVYLTKGDGKIVINGKDYKEYFAVPHIQNAKVTGAFQNSSCTEAIYDLKVNVKGGGYQRTGRSNPHGDFPCIG
jgi:small subunit ribosomal protein S9